QALLDLGDRRFARHAASGEAGVRAALGDVGYATGTVVGVEEVAVHVVTKARALIKAARSARAADRAGDAARAARVAGETGDAARAGRASEVADSSRAASAADEINIES